MNRYSVFINYINVVSTQYVSLSRTTIGFKIVRHNILVPLQRVYFELSLHGK